MNKKTLEAQLEGLLSHIRLSSDDGTGWSLKDYVERGGDLTVLSEQENHLYQAELCVMDLLMQIRPEPDEYIYHPDRGYLYMIDAPVNTAEDGAAFPSIELADEFLTAMPEDQQRNQLFNIIRRESGKYIAYTLVAQRMFATKDVS